MCALQFNDLVAVLGLIVKSIKIYIMRHFGSFCGIENVLHAAREQNLTSFNWHDANGIVRVPCTHRYYFARFAIRFWWYVHSSEVCVHTLAM